MRAVIANDNLLVRTASEGRCASQGLLWSRRHRLAAELFRAVYAERTDVAVVDIRMLPTHSNEGLRAVREIRERHPEIGIVNLSEHVDVGVAPGRESRRRPTADLTPRERQVLQLVAEGRSNQAISEEPAMTRAPRRSTCRTSSRSLGEGHGRRASARARGAAVLRG